ncbi:hypothetical protein STRMOE7_33035 [Streptomyces sp. MOE7]|nr:hypothetical protein STRMOE7_33035 [Streptomyces sp. MOE7]
MATAGCVSVSDSRSGPDPIPAHDGRTLAPDRPAPLRLPAPGRSRERMAVAEARPGGKQPSGPRTGHRHRHRPPAHRAAAHAETASRERRTPRPPRAAAPRSRPAGARPAHRHRVAPPTARKPPRPRATVDPGVVCRMATRHVRKDLLRLCRSMYGS